LLSLSVVELNIAFNVWPAWCTLAQCLFVLHMHQCRISFLAQYDHCQTSKKFNCTPANDNFFYTRHWPYW